MFLTVGLPLYRQGAIAWLAIEGLCRQQDVPCEWELIVCEEAEESLTKTRLQSYADRLSAVGCIKCTYWQIKNWVPLARKWREMARASSRGSEWFLLQGGDDYPQPHRLSETVRLAANGADWITHEHGLFLNLATGQHIVWDRGLAPPTIKLGLDKAVRTSLARELPISGRCTSVDHWFYDETSRCQKSVLRVTWNKSPNWSCGLYTHGANNICDRGNYFRAPEPPYAPTNAHFADTVPAEIAGRIREYMRAHSLSEHRLRQWEDTVAVHPVPSETVYGKIACDKVKSD